MRDLGDPTTKPYICALAVEAYWGAAFHWLVVGCMRKHGLHTDNHQGLGRKLRAAGENFMASEWVDLEQIRNNAWYTCAAMPAQVTEAERKWQNIRAWATS